MFRATFDIAFTGLFALLLMPGPPPLRAQAVSIATVTGRVTDEQGAIVPGANIKITKIDTGTVYASASNGNGIYTLPSLPIGEYQLEATAPGFQTYVQSGILLRVNDSPQINIVLKVGQVTEKVEVHANADLVQTQQNTISQVVDQQRIVELPLNGRDATQLITISGASVNHSDGTNTGSKSFFSSQSISIAGSAGNETNYLLDGGDNNDSFTSVNMPFPFPDALAEFSVETSTLPARNGLHPGGVVNAVTKSGSNSWHGDLFEFIRNGDVNAINYFAPKQDSLKRNQFGGTFGGRIIRDKLFFFGGYQRSDIRQDPSSSTAYVPTAAALAGDFSALDGAGCQAKGVARAIVDPTTGSPVPNFQVPVSHFDPVAVALAKYLPQTSDPCGKVSYGIPVQSDESQFVGRVDWIINPKHSFYGRYFVDDYTLKAFFDPHDILVTSVSGNVERAQTFVLGDTYTISPSTVNSLHFTLGRRSDDRGPNTSGVNVVKLGAANMYQGTPDFLQVAVNNGGFAIGCGTCALGRFPVTSFQYADDVDILRGKHQIAFGVDYLRTREVQENHYNDDGVFTFSGQYSNDPLLDFLTGKLSGFNQSGQQLDDLRQNVVGSYVQDTYHATSRLVINAGLRWEPFLPEYDHYNRGSTFSMAAFNAGRVSNIYANAPVGTLFAGDPGVNHSFTDRRLADFSPRLGLVYDPTGTGRTTIRVGAALLWDSVGVFIPYRMVAQNPPYGPQVTLTSGPYQFSNPWADVPGGNPFPLPPLSKDVPFPLANAEAFLAAHMHAPSVGQWNASIQHRFSDNWVFTASYIGNKTSHLWLANEINPALYIPGTCGSAACSTTGNTQARRVLTILNPKAGQYYSQMALGDDGVSANYNGMLTSVEHRFASHYTLLSNFTWSKCLGINAVTSFSTGVIENPQNVRGDYGPCTYDVPFLFNTSIVYASQLGGHGLMSHLLSHWSLAPLVRYQSGLPVNPSTGKDNSLTGIGLDRPNVVAGAQMYTGAPHGLKYQYVNPGLYTANALGTFGNAGHFSLRGPGYFDVDVALSREFKMRDRVSLAVRGETFNVLNHPNFGLPNANISSSAFGQVTSASDPRILQASMKLIF